jgi:triacylglycerol lipase
MPWLLLLALAVVAALVLLLYVAVRWRLRLRARLPPLAPLAPRYPIVLVHGFGGFDRLVGAEYFRNIRSTLERGGVRVFAPRLPALSGVAARARALTAAVNAICEEHEVGKVNLIAHSMGGLDARYAIAKLGLDSRVASLITIGTPHRGTPMADASSVLGMKVLALVAGTVGLDLAGVKWMTAASAERFNREIEDADGVYYGSVVGRATRSLRGPLRRYLDLRAGDNDGLVPVDSQRWGELIAEVDADHWQQIGWMGGFDTAGMYVDLVDQLVERGL